MKEMKEKKRKKGKKKGVLRVYCNTGPFPDDCPSIAYSVDYWQPETQDFPESSYLCMPRLGSETGFTIE